MIERKWMDELTKIARQGPVQHLWYMFGGEVEPIVSAK